MSFYSTLVRNPEVLVEGPWEETREKRELSSQIDALVLRMGEFKFRFVAPLYGLVLPPEKIWRLEAERGETAAWGGGRPELVAQAKAEERDISVRDCLTTQGLRGDNGLILSLGQDTQVCWGDGRPIYKPESTMSTLDIFEAIVSRLQGKYHEFQVKSGVAIAQGSPTHQGIMARLKHYFSTSPFAEAELELYVFGLRGKNGTSPPYLRTELEQLVAQEVILPEEMESYAAGLSLEELRQTSGAFRWPHPIFLRHIFAIDKITPDMPDFFPKRLELFLSLVGGDSQSIPLLEHAVEVFQKLEGWERLVVLKDGSFARLRSVNLVTDMPAISNLVQRNFIYHPNYKDLSEEACLEYIRANTPEGVFQNCLDPRNLACLVIERGSKIIGYAVARQETEELVEIRRLHTDLDHTGLGIGTTLEEELRYMARDRGFKRIAAVSSGTSFSFFKRRGYQGNGLQENEKLSKRGINGSQVNYCIREIL